MKYFIFKPIYQERVWGGTGLATDLGRELPEGKIIGESWEIVDRPEAQSTLTCGKTIRELIENDPKGIMGHGWTADKPFPILVKWLDCQDKLSLQVHPPASVAPKLKGEPKTENWYIAKAAPHATLMAGLKKGVTRADFENGLKTNQLDPLVHTLEVQNDESIFIPSGRLHAIGGGNLILEIQQNSDTTYRVYDWGRVGLDGKPRELHVEASLESTDFEDFEPETLKPTGANQILAESEVFKLKKVCLQAGERIVFKAGKPRILSVLSGELEATDTSRIPVSANALLPASEPFTFTAVTDSKFLVTEDFA